MPLPAVCRGKSNNAGNRCGQKINILPASNVHCPFRFRWQRWETLRDTGARTKDHRHFRGGIDVERSCGVWPSRQYCDERDSGSLHIDSDACEHRRSMHAGSADSVMVFKLLHRVHAWGLGADCPGTVSHLPSDGHAQRRCPLSYERACSSAPGSCLATRLSAVCRRWDGAASLGSSSTIGRPWRFLRWFSWPCSYGSRRKSLLLLAGSTRLRLFPTTSNVLMGCDGRGRAVAVPIE